MNNNYDFVVTGVDFCVNRRCNKGWSLSASMSKFVLVAFLSGHGVYEADGKTIEVGENDIMLFPPGMSRTAAFDQSDPWHFISISFDVRGLDGGEYSFESDIPLITHNANSHIISCFKRIDSTWTNKPKAYMNLCRTIVQDILCQLIQINDVVVHNTAHYNKIEEVKRYLNKNFTRNISVEELAAIAGLSPSHFRKVFREIVGMSATQYAIYLRINKAKDLLVSGAANVSEAAFGSGFKDIYYFSAMFKKVTGENPSKYLK